LATTSIAFGAACSDSGSPAQPAEVTSSTAATTTATSTSSTTTTTLPPALSTTSVTNEKDYVTIKGSGSLTVPLPARVPLPAIVHAQHSGTNSFVVSGVDSSGQRTLVLAASRGAYNGTFAVGFVEPGNPTAELRIDTVGPWRLDIGSASIAPALGTGRQGVGDTVLSYDGPAVTAHLTFRPKSRLVINEYENGGFVPLVDTTGPYDGPISLLPGPLFIAVTTTGKWSIMIPSP
jgi:hypothetical protein